VLSTTHGPATGGSATKEINPDACASVADMMDRAMQRFADKPAFGCADQTLSYAQVDKLSRDFAGCACWPGRRT
jgi:long-chain acyl-CoA synthetase